MQDEAQVDEVEAEGPTLEERIAALPRQLAGLRLQLELPRSLMDRDDVLNAVQECEGRVQPYVRCMSAALLLCWPAAQRKDGVPRYRGDILDYGGKVYSFLLGHGATQADILRVGGVAVSLCIQAAVAQHSAQEEARGNSLTPADGGASSSSSPSRSGSASGGVASLVLSQK